MTGRPRRGPVRVAGTRAQPRRTSAQAGGGAGRGTPHRTYSATGIRRANGKAANGSTRSRFASVRIILVVLLSIAGLQLVKVQAFDAETLSASAERQRTTPIDIPAQRGSIMDRNGTKLAFSVENRTLSVNLRLMRKSWAEYAQKHPDKGQNFETRSAAAAKFIAGKLPDKTDEQELLAKFRKPDDFTFLVDDVEPSIAAEITDGDNFPEISDETRAKREYPGGTLAANVVGVAKWQMEDSDVSKHNLHGLAGLEATWDNELAGTPGRRLVDTEQGGDVVIPGTERDLQPATAGSDLELTLDADLQYDLQSKLSDYVAKSRAKGGSAVIMDAKTGEVYALANDRTFDPNDLAKATPDQMNNRAVTTPFEPGSVNKVVTAVAALEHGIATPESVLSVPGALRVADHTVRDAWTHGTQNFTTTGIFAKSSNVGTLLLAQKLGEEPFADMLKKFGLGQRTGIGLPGESPGSVPPRNQWSGTTFGNLPIGQGLSMTVVQMAGMYQAIANGGLRVEPRVVRAKVNPDGTRVEQPAPKTTQVTTPETAKTVLDMLRATTQKGKNQNSGTAPQAALAGYQISGKTGTGQQIDPRTNAYSDSLYNITFAGVLPADNPRFVVGIHLDAPDTTLPAGHSAGPLFHDVASYLAQRYQLPLSDGAAPVVPLVLG
ncbi:peptidoglycan D,D-transpeptidase FtsI family protein [Amycolatopsis magusensis]|uniref:peptidoglycan D,D-transpeptidase FtsI family protein n=1 Tax=Amycolatopsis magusensis TaxID=882444 RepID=UPI0024A97CB4|nr:penicillin-binding protein 2 [Amycolatopsis magusensis]MDI5977248.1 penicillin-binding protein 2 [Amycolatopsis magusensis]